jgi:hypothetical protein
MTSAPPSVEQNPRLDSSLFDDGARSSSPLGELLACPGFRALSFGRDDRI